MALVVIASAWKQVSYNFLFFRAGLQSIPRSLIEAAAIDGAGPARRFWTVVFPLLSPTTFFLLVVNVVYAFFDTFGVIDATTQGGPAGSTQILVYKVYYDGVKAADLGGSSAQSVVLMLIVIALTVVQFRFPLRNFFFWMIFVTLMLPVEVRIIPTFKVVSDLGMLNSYVGLTLPLIASATATFLFRQFFLTIPEELAEAARIDGAGPMRFFRDVVLPLSKTSMAALFVIQFIYGWNQYLWPLLITTQESMYTAVIGIKRMITGGDALTELNLVMATAMLALLPPAAVVVLMQKWFVKGLVETEK